MLIKLMPEQIVRYWDFFKVGFEKSLPPIVGESPDRMNGILESLLIGGLTMWISFRKDAEVEATGFIVTQIITDQPSKTNSCLLYAIYSPDGFTFEEWKEGFEGITKYAKSRDCNRLIAYSNHEAILKRAIQFGGDTSYRFISIDL